MLKQLGDVCQPGATTVDTSFFLRAEYSRHQVLVLIAFAAVVTGVACRELAVNVAQAGLNDVVCRACRGLGRGNGGEEGKGEEHGLHDA